MTAMQITACVIGKNCCIGKNVKMKHCYLLDNVLVEDGADLTSALLCSQAHIKSKAVLLPGAVISYKVCLSCRPSRQAHRQFSSGAYRFCCDPTSHPAASPQPHVMQQPLRPGNQYFMHMSMCLTL